MLHRHPAELLFIRHAESQANRDKSEITQGEMSAYPADIQAIRDADVPLTARGIEQARATGQYLAAHPPV